MSRWLTMAGLAVVLAAAAVLSFAALRDLAVAVRIHEQLAFLLPIAVDAGAAVACAVWLSPAAARDARRFAAWLTWGLLATTVIGNAGQLGMHAYGIVPPWWVAVLVGAVPPAVVGGVVHLLVLVGREAGGTAPETAQITEEQVSDTPGAPSEAAQAESRRDGSPAAPAARPRARRSAKSGKRPQRRAERPVDLATLEGPARELVAGGAGRGQLANELAITPYQARQLLDRIRETNGAAQR